MPPNFTTKILGIIGYSGAGKTTLLERLILRLEDNDIRCAVIKSTHHNIDIDQPGKDSHRLRQAGAMQVILVSPYRRMIVLETAEHIPTLAEQLEWVDQQTVDIVLVEGFKHEPIPKIEVHIQSLQKPLIYPDDNQVLAVVSDCLPVTDCLLPQFKRDDIEPITNFIREFIKTEVSDEY